MNSVMNAPQSMAVFSSILAGRTNITWRSYAYDEYYLTFRAVKGNWASFVAARIEPFPVSVHVKQGLA